MKSLSFVLCDTYEVLDLVNFVAYKSKWIGNHPFYFVSTFVFTKT
jgi:hypothetical protein